MAELRDRFYGNTIEERVSRVPAELAVDAVGLWQIVSFGREGFGLRGDALIDYVRRQLAALFARGARPVTGAVSGPRMWVLVPYGTTAEEMTDAIIEEWKHSGTDPDHAGIWFALPHIYEARRDQRLPPNSN
jgi:hypothetical protein